MANLCYTRTIVPTAAESERYSTAAESERYGTAAKSERYASIFCLRLIRSNQTFDFTKITGSLGLKSSWRIRAS